MSVIAETPGSARSVGAAFALSQHSSVGGCGRRARSTAGYALADDGLAAGLGDYG